MHEYVKILLGRRLYIPNNTKALLWDMDGVLLDTLGLDISLCNDILKQYFGESVNVSKQFIRSVFAYDPAGFWRMILRHVE
jgi:beta-phosphoglucomutase-like phosphatase (HAD superfamily)